MHIPPASETSSEERLLAALSHVSVLLFGWGFIGALVIWIFRRQKSAFVAFHALQALAYQLIQVIYWIILTFAMVFVMIVVQILTTVIAIQAPEQGFPFLFFIGQGIFMLGLIGGIGLYALVGLTGAVLTVSRKDFRYPILGGWIERYLETDSASTELEAA